MIWIHKPEDIILKVLDEEYQYVVGGIPPNNLVKIYNPYTNETKIVSEKRLKKLINLIVFLFF